MFRLFRLLEHIRLFRLLVGLDPSSVIHRRQYRVYVSGAWRPYHCDRVRLIVFNRAWAFGSSLPLDIRSFSERCSAQKDALTVCLVFSEELCELLFWRRLLRPFHDCLRCGEVREPEGVVGLRPQFCQSVISNQKWSFISDFQSRGIRGLADNSRIVRKNFPYRIEALSPRPWVDFLFGQLVFGPSLKVGWSVQKFDALRQDQLTADVKLPLSMGFAVKHLACEFDFVIRVSLTPS